MEKWITFISGAALTMGLAACGQTAEPVAGVEDAQSAKSDLTLEEVFNKSMEASEQVESLHADILTDQNMKMQPDGMEMDMAIDTKMDMILDPLAFHQKSETTLVSDDIENDNPMLMETYLTDQGLYLYEASMDMWLKMQDEVVEDLKSMADYQTANPREQLEDLEAFKDDFTFEQNEEAYILKLDASGEKFQALMREQLKKTLGQMELETIITEEDLKIHSIYYELYIDKETFLTDSLLMNTEMDVIIDGDTMAIQSDVEAEYSDYNEIEEIILPKEAVEQAEEIE